MKGNLAALDQLHQMGRETFSISAACCVLSSDSDGTMETVLPSAILDRMLMNISNVALGNVIKSPVSSLNTKMHNVDAFLEVVVGGLGKLESDFCANFAASVFCISRFVLIAYPVNFPKLLNEIN